MIAVPAPSTSYMYDHPSGRPLLLDLFCCAGGAGMGYHRAGFDVVGIDIAPQPRYRFAFAQLDAILMLERLVAGDHLIVLDEGEIVAYGLGDFAAVHASPPCQAHTAMSNRWRGAGGRADEHEDLIAATRDLLIATGLPYVIENVVGARAKLIEPLGINGASVGLPRLDRVRLFETNWLLLVPEKQTAVDPVGVYGARPDGRRLWTRADGSEQRAATSIAEAREVMGIDWMEWRELAEAVPPAYTELIGHQLMQHVRGRAAA